MIFLEGVDYFQVHVAELAAVTLVENDDVVFGIPADEHIQLLNYGDGTDFRHESSL